MKLLLRVIVVLVVVALIVWFGGRAYLARSVPQRSGTIAAGADAEITFDAKGIPQIWARTDADAFFAIGWLHASDRLRSAGFQPAAPPPSRRRRQDAGGPAGWKPALRSGAP